MTHAYPKQIRITRFFLHANFLLELVEIRSACHHVEGSAVPGWVVPPGVPLARMTMMMTNANDDNVDDE